MLGKLTSLQRLSISCCPSARGAYASRYTSCECGTAAMLALLKGPCVWQVRARPRLSVQLRNYQVALRATVDESPLPEFHYSALLVDAAGTLLVPSEPAAEVRTSATKTQLAYNILTEPCIQVYLRYGCKYGVSLSSSEVLARFRRQAV